MPRKSRLGHRQKIANKRQKYAQKKLDHEILDIVAGNFSQFSDRFKFNTQCVCISFMSLCFSLLKSASLWISTDVDMILIEGNLFYEYIVGSTPRFLKVTDLSSAIMLNGISYRICIGNSFYAYIYKNDIFNDKDLVRAIEHSLEVSNKCLILFNQLAVSLFFDNDNVFYYDSHSRNSNSAMSQAMGVSILLKFKSIQSFISYFKDLCHDLNLISNCQFECTPITFVIDDINELLINDYIYNCSFNQVPNLQHITNVGCNGRKYKVTCASHSQFHRRYNSSTQCSAMSLQFLIQSSNSCPTTFQTADLDDILNKGDTLYNSIVTVPRLLMINELPSQISCDATMYDLILYDDLFVSGKVLMTDDPPFYSLKTALQMVLSTEETEFFFIMSVYTVAIKKVNNKFILFDSHSRNTDGLFITHESGTAVMLIFDSITNITDYFMHLCQSLNLPLTTNFEITPVSVSSNSHNVTECDEMEIASNAQKSQSKIPKSDSYIKKLESMRKKYALDIDYREHKKIQIKMRYMKKDFRVKQNKSMKEKMKMRYTKDHKYREKKRQTMKNKYSQDHEYHEKQRQTMSHTMKNKYSQDHEYHEKQKKEMHDKYLEDFEYHEKIIQRGKTYYFNNSMAKKENSRNNYNTRRISVPKCILSFRAACQEFPIYKCICCFRMLFHKTVKKFNMCQYSYTILKKCIPNFLDLTKTCTSKTDVYVCCTCQKYLQLRKMPPQSVNNNLDLDVIPPELSILNKLEKQLIALVIPFLKILPMSRSSYAGVKGPVIYVPSESSILENTFDNTITETLIPVKLKRKLEYKSHYTFQTIDVTNIKKALKFLKDHNPLFEKISVSDNWLNSLPTELFDNDDSDVEMTDISIDQSMNVKESSISDCTENIEELPDHIIPTGFVQDTCLQNVDLSSVPSLASDTLNLIYSVAPGESNKPLLLFKERNVEQKCYPALFPRGNFGFDTAREVKVSLTQYYNQRLLNSDNRFAQDSSFIFHAQYLIEHSFLRSSMSMAFRKTSKSENSVTRDMLIDSKSVSLFLKNDTAFTFMNSLRGTPAFWNKILKGLFATIRQLGIPTWFATFSSAEFRWPEFVTCIAMQNSKQINFNDLTWNEKYDYLNLNPVTFCRMFYERVNNFIKEIILAPSNPIGKVIDYFYRVEFQARGSPHIHCLFWVSNAPKYNVSTDSDVTNFIDNYLSCTIPDEATDTELHNIVKSVQMHSKKHTRSCYKYPGSKVCRYGFPKLPSDKTIIARKNKDDSYETSEAKSVLKKLWQLIQSSDIDIELEEHLKFLNLSTEEYEECIHLVCNRDTVILKRSINEAYVNGYNADLLRAWNANLDLQYVLDPYACLIYILSYITKAEHSMSILLEETIKQAREDDLELKEKLKKVATQYINSREISVCESVYRTLSLPLRKSSRDVTYINCHHSCTRLSKPLISVKHGNDENIFESNIVDKYIARPTSYDFKYMCLATFASEHRFVPATAKCVRSRKYNLQNNLGSFVRRKSGSEAIINYPKFSKENRSEDFFEVLLNLYVPFTDLESLKPDIFASYEDFFSNGYITMKKKKMKVSDVVNLNKSIFEPSGNIVNQAFEDLKDVDYNDDMFNFLAPTCELEKAEFKAVTKELDRDDDFQNVDIFPNNETNKILPFCVETDESIVNLSSELNIMNSEQQTIFFYVRKWCLDKIRGVENLKPLHLFITGAAGCGKSLLIKFLIFEINRMFRRCFDENKKIVKVVAPTGIAAKNVNGSTIHNFLNLSINLSIPYVPLGESTLNTLRAKSKDLVFLFIDETSMVSEQLLTYINGRLCQIKQTYAPFGKVCILCFGDMYQLGPIKSTTLYKNYGDPFSLWNHFSIFTLHSVMRQDEIEFINMLNRFRTQPRGKPLSEFDVAILRERECVPKPVSALRIFAKNIDVDAYNCLMLEQSTNEIHKILCIDNVSKACLKSKSLLKKALNECLPEILQLSVGARVMLVKNISVEDGLCNGSLGILVKIFDIDPKTNMPKGICVKFDDQAVGQLSMQKNKWGFNIPKDSVFILPYEETCLSGQACRKQFPIKVAFAVTAHKSQGLTLDKVVVSLKGAFCPGLNYVAMSRCKSLDGLYISDFYENNHGIYCNSSISSFLEAMPKVDLAGINPLTEVDSDNFCIVHHNVEGLRKHLFDIFHNFQIKLSDVFIATETYLKNDREMDNVKVPGYTCYHFPRKNCIFYNQGHNISRGGVSIYLKDNISHVLKHFSGLSEIECLCVYFPEFDLYLFGCYRSPEYPINEFCHYFLSIMRCLEVQNAKNIIIMGDFNENLKNEGGNHIFFNLLNTFNFQQHIKAETTNYNTLIDCVYYKGTFTLTAGVLQSYFSYHLPIYCSIST